MLGCLLTFRALLIAGRAHTRPLVPSLLCDFLGSAWFYNSVWAATGIRPQVLAALVRAMDQNRIRWALVQPFPADRRVRVDGWTLQPQFGHCILTRRIMAQIGHTGIPVGLPDAPAILESAMLMAGLCSPWYSPARDLAALRYRIRYYSEIEVMAVPHAVLVTIYFEGPPNQPPLPPWQVARIIHCPGAGTWMATLPRMAQDRRIRAIRWALCAVCNNHPDLEMDHPLPVTFGSHANWNPEGNRLEPNLFGIGPLGVWGPYGVTA